MVHMFCFFFQLLPDTKDYLPRTIIHLVLYFFCVPTVINLALWFIHQYLKHYFCMEQGFEIIHFLLLCSTGTSFPNYLSVWKEPFSFSHHYEKRLWKVYLWCWNSFSPSAVSLAHLCGCHCVRLCTIKA